jgi:hypothetical protein
VISHNWIALLLTRSAGDLASTAFGTDPQNLPVRVLHNTFPAAVQYT